MTENSITPPKVKQRSAAYPSYTLKECIDMTSTLFSRFTTTVRMTRENIATAFGKSQSTIQMITSSAVQYGLLDKESGEGYRVASIFVNIYKPLDELEKKKALLQCFSHPKLYADLIKEFNGKVLPDNTGLATLLYRNHLISDAVSEKAAEVFAENAAYVGVLNEYRVFDTSKAIASNVERVEAEEEINSHPNLAVLVQTESLDNKNEKQKEPSPAKSHSNEEPLREVGYDSFIVKLKGNRMAKVLMPTNADIKDFDVIINWARLNKDSLYDS